MDEVEAKLKEAEENYKKQKELLDNRLIAVYESSDTQYLDVILSSKNISDFLSNYFLITELATKDTELLEDMQGKKEEIELAKNKLEKDREQLGNIKVNQTKTAKILENTKTVRENYISKLSVCAKGYGSIFSLAMMRESRKNRWWSILHALSILSRTPNWRHWCLSAI